ncbi:MAG: hypothetical protein ACFFA4_12545 [Promethearchaeota archaeon]
MTSSDSYHDWELSVNPKQQYLKRKKGREVANEYPKVFISKRYCFVFSLK